MLEPASNRTQDGEGILRVKAWEYYRCLAYEFILYSACKVVTMRSFILEKHNKNGADYYFEKKTVKN